MVRYWHYTKAIGLFLLLLYYLTLYIEQHEHGRFSRTYANRINNLACSCFWQHGRNRRNRRPIKTRNKSEESRKSLKHNNSRSMHGHATSRRIILLKKKREQMTKSPE